MRIRRALLIVVLSCAYGCGERASAPSQLNFLAKARTFKEKSRDAATFLDLDGTLPGFGDRVATLTSLISHLPPVPADTKYKTKVEESLLAIYNELTFGVRLLVLKSKNGDKANREELEKEQAEIKDRIVDAIIKNCNFLDATLGFDDRQK